MDATKKLTKKGKAQKPKPKKPIKLTAFGFTKKITKKAPKPKKEPRSANYPNRQGFPMKHCVYVRSLDAKFYMPMNYYGKVMTEADISGAFCPDCCLQPCLLCERDYEVRRSVKKHVRDLMEGKAQQKHLVDKILMDVQGIMSIFFSVDYVRSMGPPNCVRYALPEYIKDAKREMESENRE